MRAGMLNRRVRIERRSGDGAGSGQPLDDWTLVAEVWANIKGHTGMGVITGLQDNVAASIEKYSIRIRYMEDIAPDMRVIYRETIFDIRQIRMDFDRRDWTDLICEVGGSNG